MIATHNPGTGFLWDVESRKGTLAIVDVPAFDSHLKSNPMTTLRLAEWRHPIGMDIGVAVLAENKNLIGDINAAIAALPAHRLRQMAQDAGMTYALPKSSELMPAFTMQMLQRLE